MLAEGAGEAGSPVLPSIFRVYLGFLHFFFLVLLFFH